MIYLIEDKTSRRSDYGWSDQEFEKYSDVISCVSTVEDIERCEPKILEDSNVVLFHESFKDSVRPEEEAYIDSFKSKLTNPSLKVAFFSGSKTYRLREGNKCYLHPHILYRNLLPFINKYQEYIGDNNAGLWNYLMFGYNPEIEKILHNEILKVNDSNTIDQIVEPTEYKLFFAISKDEQLQLEIPFEGENVYIQEIINGYSDKDFDVFIETYLSSNKYDLIYVPLCFGHSLSDYLGLRLSLQIKLSDTINKNTPIVIYGESNVMNFLNHECLGVLKMHGVYYVSGKSRSIVESLKYVGDVKNEDYVADVKTLNLPIPANYGDTHSVANEWGAGILNNIIHGGFSDSNKEKAKNNLYFKYLICRANLENDKNRSSVIFEKINAEGNHILLIDDEADKGWKTAIENFFEKTQIETCTQKISKYEDLPKYIKDKFDKGYYDLVFLDLRLNGQEENDILDPQEFSGMDVLRKIKEYNGGVQVIMLTASNKAWNMKALLDAGADGYYIKESPEYAFTYEYSYNNTLNLCENIKYCLSISKNLKSIWDSVTKIKSVMDSNNLANKYFTGMDVMHGLKYQTLISKELDVVWSLIRSHNEKKIQLSMLSLFKILEFLTEFFYTKNSKGQLSLIDPSFPELMFWDNGKWYKKGDSAPMYKMRKIDNNIVDRVTKKDLESTTTKVHNIMKYVHIVDQDKTYSYIRSLGNERNGYIHAKNSAVKSNPLSLSNIDIWINAIEKICGKL